MSSAPSIDVVVGQHVAVGRDDHARAEADLRALRRWRARSPKKKRNAGSSLRGARCGAWLAVMLTTAGDARLAAAA